jgi:hypothetical protein
MDIPEQLTGLAPRLLSPISISSTLNPLIWLSLAVSLTFFPTAFLFRQFPALLYPLVYVPIITVIGTVVVGLFYAFTSPARLDSERHRELMEHMHTRDGLLKVSPEAEMPVRAPTDETTAIKASS